MANPDFYLASTEGYDPEEPRACRSLKRLDSALRDDLMLVEIESPLMGQKYGLGSCDIHPVIIATRHQGYSIFPITAWPAFVHVARPLIENADSRATLDDEDFEEIAWAEFCRTEQDSRAKAM